MKIFVTTALAGSIWGLILSDSISAQPILNRVEQSLRDQVAGQKSAAAPNAGAAEQGYLGVIADDRKEEGKGVRILNVVAGGPAATGGLKNGDLITSINGHAIHTMEDMGGALRQMPPGAKLPFVVHRDGADQTVQVTLGTRPPAQPIGKISEDLPDPHAQSPPGGAAAQGPRLGVRTLPVSEEARQQNNLPDTNGAVVVSIAVGSGAEKVGIPLGAVITAVNGQPIKSPHELAIAVRAAGSGEVELTYIFGGEENRRRVSLGMPAAAEQSPPPQLGGRIVARPTPGIQPSDGPGLEPQPAEDPRTAALEERIRQLEERIEKLEAARAGEPK